MCFPSSGSLIQLISFVESLTFDAITLADSLSMQTCTQCELRTCDQSKTAIVLKRQFVVSEWIVCRQIVTANM